jgi:hypothetical protein
MKRKNQISRDVPLYPFWIVGVLLVVAIMMGGSCGRSKPSASKPSLELDFSTSRPASQIPTSKEKDWDEDYISLYDVNVSVKCPGGRDYHGHVFSISFHRTGGQIDLVRILFDEDNISGVRSLASTLADEWGLPKDEIERWYGLAKAGKWNRSKVDIIDNSSIPSRELKLVNSYDHTGQKPAAVHLILVWPGFLETSKPSTTKGSDTGRN